MAKRTYDVVQPLYGFTVADDCPLVVEPVSYTHLTLPTRSAV